MCGTRRLVASRFETWTKPIMFHTAVVRRHDNWMQRVEESLLSNGRLIRILVLDLALRASEGCCFDRVQREKNSEKELSLLRRLLEACEQVNHLAVTWNVWDQLQRECAALRLSSLYLIWDGTYGTPAPSLDGLQHPAVLKDLTLSAPGIIHEPSWRQTSYLSLPPRVQTMTQCSNIAYVAYASNQRPSVSVASYRVKWSTLVLTQRFGRKPYRHENTQLQRDQDECSSHSVVCFEDYDQVLEEWVAKMEGRASLLNPPMER